MKPFANLTRLGVLAVTAGLILIGCGGGGGGGGGSNTSPAQPLTAVGQLVDAPVAGVSYQSGTQTGVTGLNGEFVYEIGKTIRFFIGRIEIGEVLGKSLVTPLDLVSDGYTTTDGVINLARFLQSLDVDVNDDHITIPEDVRRQAGDIADSEARLDFKTSSAFAANAPNVLSRLTTGNSQYNVVVNLVDITTAALHLKNSLKNFGIHVDIPGQKPAGNAAALTRFASAGELETYLKNGLKRNVESSGYWKNFVDTSEAFATGSTTQTGGSTERVSTTNLQEAGVDEADIVKSDGRYLYIAVNPHSGPCGPKTAAESCAGTLAYPVIRVLEVSSQPPASVFRTEIPLTDFGSRIDGMYLINSRGNGKPDLLAAVGGGTFGSSTFSMWSLWANPWFWQNGKTEIVIYDVSTPATPVQVTRLTLDGGFIASRRIDEVLYVVTRYTPTLMNFKIYPMSDQETQQNESILQEAKLADLLPNLTVNGLLTGSLVRANDTFLPPKEMEQPEQADLISITAINLNSPETPITQTIVTSAETVYVSLENLYLATTRLHYSTLGLPWVGIAQANTEIPDIPPETTDIHQFAMTPTGPQYQGSGSVIGHLGWEVDKRPFRFSELDGVLRVATSLGETWDETSRTRLSLLKQTDGADGVSLAEIAFIDHIGKPGEKLYAVRYVGKRAYLVTFRKIDPLYVFDLSDPKNPAKLGELHIEGYSDYLHPVGDNLILGIGKDAVPDPDSTDFGGRFAWYQGVKLSLFDVSDPSTLTEVSSIVLGKRGTESDALIDHHALTYLAPVDTKPARLAIPVQLHDTIPNNQYFDPEKPSTYYTWTHTGLYLFEIDTGDVPEHAANIRNTGRMVVSERSESQTYKDGWWFSDRSVLVGENVHYVHQGQVWSAAWNEPKILSGPE